MNAKLDKARSVCSQLLHIKKKILYNKNNQHKDIRIDKISD